MPVIRILYPQYQDGFTDHYCFVVRFTAQSNLLKYILSDQEYLGRE